MLSIEYLEKEIKKRGGTINPQHVDSRYSIVGSFSLQEANVKNILNKVGIKLVNDSWASHHDHVYNQKYFNFLSLIHRQNIYDMHERQIFISENVIIKKCAFSAFCFHEMYVCLVLNSIINELPHFPYTYIYSI